MALRVTILAIGRLKGAAAELAAEYEKRIRAKVGIREFEITKKLPAEALRDAECAKLLDGVPDGACVVMCDERGKDCSSRELAALMDTWTERGGGHVCFVLGGANGLTDEARKRAHALLSFGKKTWPHLLARVMLLEQIYRAQEISAGHPYHRD